MTKDAEALLCICYHDYLERVKSGQSKTESRYFLKTIFMRLILSLHGMRMIFIPHAQNYNICITLKSGLLDLLN